jgi:ubiquinone/menaquinone biosynthesis C-methylase UbiE
MRDVDVHTDGVASADSFDSAAKTYDLWYESPVNRLVDQLERRSVIRFLPEAARGALLLDVGCGTGHWLPVFRDAGYSVIGIDLSRGMLAVARGKFGTGTDLVRGDALRLPFPGSCFDTLCSITTLEFVGDYAGALDEMYRCLRPGGTLVVGVLNARSLLSIKRKLSGSRIFREAHFFTVGELKRCLAKYGGPRTATCSFAPPSRFLLPVAMWLETAGRALAPGLGQFITASVRKPEREPHRSVSPGHRVGSPGAHERVVQKE